MQRFAIALGIFTAACGSSKPTAVDARATAPTVAVTASPATVAPGDTVTFAITVERFKIISPLTQPPVKDGEGHYHYYLDDAEKYTAGWTPTVAFKTPATLAPGPHTMRFVLATNAHEEVVPIVETTATFTVQ